MTTFRFTYQRTGRTGSRMHEDRGQVWINTGDMRRCGFPVRNITDAIEYFEELAEGWGTYENRNAIVEIKVEE